MRKFMSVLAVALTVVVAGTSSVSAGIVTKLLREAAGGGAGRAAREGFESATKQGARRGVRQGGKLVARVGDDVAAPLVAKFGDDGARALASLSQTGAERLSLMSIAGRSASAGSQGGNARLAWGRLLGSTLRNVSFEAADREFGLRRPCPGHSIEHVAGDKQLRRPAGAMFR